MRLIQVWSLALVVFFQASSAWAAATLMGVVRENQVGGNLVKNVSVSALGGNPVVTGADCQFVLHFPHRQPGEDVSIDVSRKGWVVVNDVQLKRVVDARYRKKLAAAGWKSVRACCANGTRLARQLAARPAGSGGEDYQKGASLFSMARSMKPSKS